MLADGGVNVFGYIVTIKPYTSFAVNVNVQISAKSSFDDVSIEVKNFEWHERIILSNKYVTPHPRQLKIINLPL